jgi:hypothetical protein
VVWGVIDLLLVATMISILVTYSDVGVKRQKIFRSLLKISIPRIVLSAINTIVFLVSIAIISAFSAQEENYERVFYLVKNSYSILLLLDVVGTDGIDNKGKLNEGGGDDSEKFMMQTFEEVVGIASPWPAYTAPEAKARTFSLSKEQLLEIGSVRPMSREE